MARASMRACTAIMMSVALGGAGVGLTPLAVSRVAGQSVLPSRVYSDLNRGIDCYRRGDFERAATFLQQAQAGQDCLSNDGKAELNKHLDLNNKALQGRREGASLLKKAEEAVQAGNYGEAAELLKQVSGNQFLTYPDRTKAQHLADQVKPGIPNTSSMKPPEISDVQAMTLARTKLKQARTLMNKGDFDAAEVIAREVLQMKGLSPFDMREDTPGKLLEEIGRARNDPKITLNMGRTAYQRGDLDTAESLGQKAKMMQKANIRFLPSLPSFGDSPEKLLRDVKEARMKGGVMATTPPSAPAKQAEVPGRPKEAPSRIESLKNFFKGDAEKPEAAPKNDTAPQSKNTPPETAPVAKKPDADVPFTQSVKTFFTGNDAPAAEKPEAVKKADATPVPVKKPAVEETPVAKKRDSDVPFTRSVKNFFTGNDTPEKTETAKKPEATPSPVKKPEETPVAKKPVTSDIKLVEFTTPATGETDTKPKPATPPALQPAPTVPALQPAPATKPEVKKPEVKAEPRSEAKPAAPGQPTADSAAKPKTPGENARALVKQARKQLEDGNATRAKQFVSEAQALKVQFNWWEDTPEKVNADIQRAAAKSSTSAVAHSESVPAANGSTDKKPAGEDKNLDALLKKGGPKTKADAKALVGMGRERLKGLQLEDAEMLASRAKQVAPDGWGLFEDSPDKLLLDVRRVRDQVGREESVKLLSEARKLYQQGELEEARAKAARAERLHGPYSIWDIGDRPQKLLTQIEVAEAKKPKEVTPTSPYAPALAAKDKDKKPAAKPEIKVATAPPPPTPVDKGSMRPAVNPNERPQMAAKPALASPLPVTPSETSGVGKPMVINPIEQAKLAEARRILVTARDFLKQGDFVRARTLADQVETMGVNLNRPGEDSPGAIHRDIQIAQAAKEQPDVIPIPTHAVASDPAKVWAKQLMADVARLNKEGKLIEARQKALVAVEAQKSGANFEEEEVTPERALLQLAGQASKQIETLLNESADYMATAAVDPSRYQKAEEDLQQAHQLAVGFALDTQPIRSKLVVLRQTRDKTFAAMTPPVEAPAPTPVPEAATPLAEVKPPMMPPVTSPTVTPPTAPLAEVLPPQTPSETPLAEVKPPQMPAVTPPTSPLAEVKPPQMPTVTPPTAPLAEMKPPMTPDTTPLAEIKAPEAPGIATITENGSMPAVNPGTTPRLNVAQHQEIEPHQHGLDLLDKARLEIRNGKTVMARQLAEEAYKGEFGVQREAEIVLHTIDAEEFNQRKLVAVRTFQAANSALRRGENERARNMFVNLDHTLLEGDALARYKEIMRTPQMQPKAVAQAEPLPSLTAPPGAGKATASDQPPPAQLAPPADENFAGKVSAMQEIQFQKLREDNLRVQREAIERFRAGEPERALEILQGYLGELSDCQLDANRVAQLRRPVESRLEQFKTMKQQADLATVKNARNDSIGEIRKASNKAEEMKQQKVAELMKQYHSLYKEAKYRDAEYAAMKAHELDPDNVAADAAQAIAHMAVNQAAAQTNKENKEHFVLDALNDTDHEGPPVNIDNPVAFDGKRWSQIKNRKGAGVDFTVKSEKDREIERRLTQPISFDFKNASMKQVIEDLRELSGINVLADTRAITDKGISLDQPLTMKLEQVSLKSALNLLLDKVNLTYVIKDEVLQITTADRAKGNLVARTFQVADIVIPVDNFVNNSPANLNNAIDRMSATNRQGFSTGVAPYTGPNSMSGGLPTGSPGDSPGSLGTASPGSGAPKSPLPTPASPGKMTRQPGQTLEDVLIKLITNTIAPNSWAEMGGPGTIDYFPLGMALVVNQTPDIQEQIQELLTALRRLQDVEVAIEVRFITISESFYERIGLNFNVNVLTDTARFEPQIVTGNFTPPTMINQFTPGHAILGITPAGTFTHDLDIPINATSFGPATPPFGGFPIAPGADGGLSLGLAFLSDIQVFLFMEAAQGDRRTNVMQAPKLTMFNAQTATINVLDTVFFVTGNIIGLFNGQVIYNPQNQPFNIGLSLTLQPVVSADRRFVRVSLAPTLTNLTTPLAALFPITTVVTPVFDTGNVGQPVPITQYLQQPAFTTVGVQTTVSVPDGGTVLLGGLKTLREGRNEFGPPVLSKMPWVNRLFKNVGYGRDAESLLLMVTPRIIINEEEEANFLRP